MKADLSEAMSASPFVESHDLAQPAVARPTALAVSNGQLAVLALLATMGMLFAGFASAYLVRRQGMDWAPEQLPGILGLNTLVLLASSAALEAARAAQRRGLSRNVRRWVAAGALLGVMFLAGQLLAWQQLAARGVYLPTSPYSSFFFVLTAVHAVHLLGGILALGYLVLRISRSRRIEGSLLHGCAVYWHFVDVVWVLLYVVLLSY